MNLKFRILLTIVGCLLTISLLIGFSYAYIRHSTLSNNLINGNSKFIVPYNLIILGGDSVNMVVNQSDLTVATIGNVVSSANQTLQVSLKNYVGGTVKCVYEALFRFDSDDSTAYWSSGDGEYTISANISLTGYGAGGTTTFTPFEVPSMYYYDEIAIGTFYISATGIGSNVYQTWKFTHNFYNVDADQFYMNRNIKAYLNFKSLGCEVIK